MMRYLDRDGQEISSFDWKRRSLDPAYCSLACVRLASGTLECSWVGVWVPSREPRPLPFVVLFTPGHGGLMDRREGWYQTQDDAMGAYAAILGEVGDG